MLDQVLMQLAAAGGAAVVGAAATDGWTAVRERVAGWFGRGGDQLTELVQLDQARSALRFGDFAEAERIRAAQTQALTTLFVRWLESLGVEERRAAVDRLRRLDAEWGRGRAGWSAAWSSGPQSSPMGTVNGPVTIHNHPVPRPPDQNQG
ncbi:hypothetical protein AB0I00_37515 [Streptomyces sp. NPDC050803]|uniref:hypothetical protein n=1 Tax=unclassified Streptomyces TaxID=2593676 RepID=UPI0034258789